MVYHTDDQQTGFISYAHFNPHGTADPSPLPSVIPI